MNDKDILEEYIRTNHSVQRGFMDQYETEEGQKLKNMNLREDGSCVTDNDPFDNFIKSINLSKDFDKQNQFQNQELSPEKQTSGKQDTDDRCIMSSNTISKHQRLTQKQTIFKERKEGLEGSDDNTPQTNNKVSLNKQFTTHKQQTLHKQFTTHKTLAQRVFESQKEFFVSEETDGHLQGSLQSSQNYSEYLKSKYKKYEHTDTVNIILIEKIKNRMKNFIQKYTDTGKLINLEKRSVHQTLNDKSDGYFINKSQMFIIQMLKQIISHINFFLISKFLSKIPVLNAQSKISLTLQIIRIIFTTFFLLIHSIIIVFEDVLIGEQEIVYKTALIVWGIDIIIILNTSTYESSNIITDRKTILFYYFKKSFIWDIVPAVVLISIILFNNSYSDQDNKVSSRLIPQIICFVKLFNLSSDLNDMQKKLCMMMKRYYIMKLANLIIKLFIIGHCIACAWYMIAVIETKFLGEEVTWYHDSIASDFTWWKVYLLSMYWGLTLMTTGSNTATTVLQTFFTSFIMLFTTIISGYMLNATGSILSEIDASEENKRNDLNIVNEYMRQKNISMDLQSRVNIYLEYYYQKNYSKQSEDIKGVLSKISTELRSLLQKEFFFQILTKIDFLQRNFTTKTLQNMSIECEEVIFFPNQVIFEENDYRDAALLMIIEGQVEIYQQIGYDTNEQKTICFLNSGQILGQINFFTGMARSACAKSKGFTKLAKISRESFLSVVQETEKDLQTFYQMKDNILLYENYEAMNIRCSACQSYKHLQGSCSLVHLNKNLVMEKVRIQNKFKQERKTSIRYKKIKVNSFKILKLVEERIFEFQKLESNFENLPASLKFCDLEDEDNIDDDSSFDSNKISHLNNSNEAIQDLSFNIQSGIEYDDYQGQRSKNNSEFSLTPSRISPSKEEVFIHDKGPHSSSNIQNDLNENQKKIKKLSIKSPLPYQNQYVIDIQNAEPTLQLNQDAKKKKLSLQYPGTDSMKVYKSKQSKEEIVLGNKRESEKNHNYSVKYEIASPEERQNNFIKLNKRSSNPNNQQENKKKQSQDKKLKPIQRNSDGQANSSKRLTRADSMYSINSEQNDVESKFNKIEDEKQKLIWQMDKLKDYEYYFNHGNSRIRIQQLKLFQKMQERKMIQTYLLKSVKSTHLRKAKYRNSTQIRTTRRSKSNHQIPK